VHVYETYIYSFHAHAISSHCMEQAILQIKLHWLPCRSFWRVIIHVQLWRSGVGSSAESASKHTLPLWRLQHTCVRGILNPSIWCRQQLSIQLWVGKHPSVWGVRPCEQPCLWIRSRQRTRLWGLWGCPHRECWPVWISTGAGTGAAPNTDGSCHSFRYSTVVARISSM
jgi:hypothetical protein